MFSIQWNPAIMKCHGAEKNVRYSEDPVITNYLVNNKLNKGLYTTQISLQTYA